MEKRGFASQLEKKVDKLEKELDLIENISIKSSIAIGSIALNYCLIQNCIDGVLIGVDSLEQIKENLKKVGIEL